MKTKAADRSTVPFELVASHTMTLSQVEFLEDRLYEFNMAATGIRDGVGLGFLVRDEMGQTIAGVAGHTWGGTCDIRQLWVREDYRHQGLGSRLLAAAEDEALRRGCSQLVLTTHSFQAPAFYENLGFEVLYRLEDYPRGHAHLLLRKRFRGGPER